MSKRTKKAFVYRSAVTGRYVKRGYALRYPHLTIEQPVRKRQPCQA